jgi:hypothetical protein
MAKRINRRKINRKVKADNIRLLLSGSDYSPGGRLYNFVSRSLYRRLSANAIADLLMLMASISNRMAKTARRKASPSFGMATIPQAPQASQTAGPRKPPAPKLLPAPQPKLPMPPVKQRRFDDWWQ